jgi:hypothetical protein
MAVVNVAIAENQLNSVIDAKVQTLIPSNNVAVKGKEEPRPHPHAGARYPDGKLNYIPDPTSLQKGRESYLKSLKSKTQIPEVNYWKALVGYENRHRDSKWSRNENLSSEYVCGVGPGRGVEQESGYKLLTEKIKIHDANADAKKARKSPRILCGMYTYSAMRDLTRTQALTWGYKCDGFLAFSNETIPSLGIVDLLHQGEESYNSMWQKTRSIWAYIYDHLLDDFDYFHLGGDDMYVMVENLRHFLTEVHATTIEGTPLHFGQWAKTKGDKYMITGGPGYTLNAAAVKRLVEDALPTCAPNFEVSHEDRMISNCLSTLGIEGSDTREFENGEQQYHDTSPAMIYMSRSTARRHSSWHSRISLFWEGLEHPNKRKHSNATVGPKHGLDAAAQYSISFHELYSSLYVSRVHAITYRNLCPQTSPLGIGLRYYQNTA